MFKGEEDFFQSFEKILKQIKKAKSDAAELKKRQSHQNFIEKAKGLFEKKDSLDKAGENLKNFRPDMNLPPSSSDYPDLCTELQVILHDHTTVFHQEIYNSVSAFLAFVRICIAEKKRQGITTSSMEKFYGYVLKRIPTLFNEISILEESRKFRRLIVHSQLESPHNWLSMENRIIYYIPGELTEEALKQYKDIIQGTPLAMLKEDPFPPVSAEKFFVPPKPEETLDSFIKMSKKFLKEFTDKNLRKD